MNITMFKYSTHKIKNDFKIADIYTEGYCPLMAKEPTEMQESYTSRKTAVIILNYKNWEDSIACAKSVLSGKVKPQWLILIDNASPNKSFEQLAHWAKQAVPATQLTIRQNTEELNSNTYHPVNSITLIKSPHNNGYAAGNNIGLSLALHLGAEAFWILNNDTIVSANALDEMVNCLFQKQRPGLCGSLICYQHAPELVQCRAGGKTNKWTGLSCLNGSDLNVKEALAISKEQVESHINFIYGASVMASREFIETVGLLDERYFLYSEEQDWAYSAGGRFDLAYAPNAIVYHKGGGSTGFSPTKSSLKAFWHLTRSRVLLTWKHHPEALPTVGLSICWAALRIFWRRCLQPVWQKLPKINEG